MGTFVDKVPVRSVNPDNPWSEISDVIDQVMGPAGYVADSLADLQSAIDTISAAIGSYEPDFAPDVSWNIDDLPDRDIPEFPEAPTIDIDLNDNWTDTDIPDPNLVDVTGDFSYVEPTEPGELNPSFDFTTGVYSSDIDPEITAKILYDLQNGGTGLTDLVYGLIIDRNQAARRDVQDSARRRAVNAVGATGFDFPGGMAAAVLLEIEKEILAKDVDAVNSTTIKDFEVADANTRFIKQLAVTYEEMKRRAFSDDESRLLEVAKISTEMILAIYEQNVKVYIAKWEAVKIKMDSVKTQIEALVAQNDGEIKTFIGRADILKAQIAAISSENKAKTDVALAEADIYKSEVQGIAAQVGAIVDQIRADIEKYKADIMMVVEQEGLNLKSFTSASELAERGQEAIAQFSSQTVASALGMVSTSMTLGYHGSDSKSYGATVSNSLSEGHAYEDE